MPSESTSPRDAGFFTRAITANACDRGDHATGHNHLSNRITQWLHGDETDAEKKKELQA
jgi:hypothetical protein